MATKLEVVAVFLATLTGVFSVLTAALTAALWVGSHDQASFGFGAVIVLLPSCALFLVMGVVAGLWVSHRRRSTHLPPSA